VIAIAKSIAWTASTGPAVAPPADAGAVVAAPVEADSGTDSSVDSTASVVGAIVAVGSCVAPADEGTSVGSLVAGSPSELQADPTRHSAAVTRAADARWVFTTPR